MIVDGRAIADEILLNLRTETQKRDTSPHLTVFTAAPNFETQKFLALKKEKAEEIGIAIRIIEFSENVTTEEIVTSITQTAADTDGIIVQLPLPKHVLVDEIINAIPATHDVDGLRPNVRMLSPVVGACAEIAERNNIVFAEKQAVVIGQGRLVGIPAVSWLRDAGAHVTTITKDTADIGAYTKDADIIVLGTGVPGLLQPEMIKDGVVIFDAGTSEDQGKLAGDASPACAEKASLFTPVPGGIGPITVALIFRNLLDLASRGRST